MLFSIFQMTSCKFCHSGSHQYYLYTNCHHFICTVCAFQRADFSLQSIQCCGNPTPILEDSMAIIIKSRRFKLNSHLDLPKDKTILHNDSNIRRNLQQSHNASIQDLYDDIVSEQSKKQRSIIEYNINMEKQKLELEKILLTQIQRIKNEFDGEHQKLREKQKNMVNQLLSTYEEELKNIFGQHAKTIKIDEIREDIRDNQSIKFLKDSTKKSIIDKKIDDMCLKLSRYTCNQEYNGEQEHLKQKVATTRQESINLDQKKEEQKEWQKISQPKKNRVEYDYILKKLEINQERMNDKLQRHAHISA